MTDDGRRRRRRRKPTSGENVDMKDDKLGTVDMAEEAAILAKKAHQCPVPKPTGLIGQVLGFGSDKRDRER